MSDKHKDAQGAVKFRKKPVEIEAIQWTGKLVCLDPFNIPELHQSLGSSQVGIPTLEGTMIASVGDWIIKGIKGEFYPCKPDIFELTYELASEGQAQTSAAAIPLPEYELLRIRQDMVGSDLAIYRDSTVEQYGKDCVAAAQLADKTEAKRETDPGAQEEDYVDCPACFGSNIKGEKRGVRCSTCSGSGCVAAPTAQQSTAGGAVPGGDAVPVEALRDYADKWLINDALAKSALLHVIDNRSFAAAPLMQVQPSEALREVGKVELTRCGWQDWAVYWKGDISKNTDGLYYRNYKVGDVVTLYAASQPSVAQAVADTTGEVENADR